VKRKAKLGPVDSQNGEHQPISDDLRGWIEHVIVPILVKEFVRAKGLRKEANDG